jgi:hypothetical protein
MIRTRFAFCGHIPDLATVFRGFHTSGTVRSLRNLHFKHGTHAPLIHCQPFSIGKADEPSERCATKSVFVADKPSVDLAGDLDVGACCHSVVWFGYVPSV